MSAPAYCHCGARLDENGKCCHCAELRAAADVDPTIRLERGGTARVTLHRESFAANWVHLSLEGPGILTVSEAIALANDLHLFARAAHDFNTYGGDV